MSFGGLFNIGAILGLIMAVIFVTIGVNMLPGLNTTIAAITTPTYSTGVAGLIGVVLIVYSAINNTIVASGSNPSRITGLIQGNLNQKWQGNPELSLGNFLSKCAETLHPVSLWDSEKVRS